MATNPMPNPQASAPQPGADAGASGAQQGGQGGTGNPLIDMLGSVALGLKKLGAQNTVIQPDINTAVQALVSAIQKVQQASGSQPQQSAAPPQQ